MRITLLNQFYLPDLSPTAHMAGSLAEDRAARGDEVTVVASRSQYVPESTGTQKRQAANLRILSLPSTSLGKGNLLFRLVDYLSFYVAAAWRLTFLARQDVIISLTTPPFIYLAALGHKLLHPRTRLVLWIQDCYPEMAERTEVIREGGLLSRLLRAINRFVFHRLARIVVLDRAMERLIRENYASEDCPLPIRTIPNWERAELFDPDRRPAPWPRLAELDLEDKFIVLYLGNAGYGHRLDTVIEAARLMEGEKTSFLFIGGGSRWPWLREEVARHGLENVVVLDYIPKSETPSVLASADCALVSLRDEIAGLISPSKIHSCLAMGLPLISLGPLDDHPLGRRSQGNVDEAIRRFDCGVTIRHGDHPALIEYCRRLAGSPDELAAYSERARAAFDEAYSDRSTLPAFDALLSELDAGNRSAGRTAR
jgi:glycosyltransferase involved in cell wall biosynthesis